MKELTLTLVTAPTITLSLSHQGAPGPPGGGGLEEAPEDGTPYSRQDAAWVGAEVKGSAAAVQANLDAHEADLANPHAVTAAQAGADPAGSAGAVQTDLDAHKANSSIHFPDAPSDGTGYVRKDGAWAAESGGSAPDHSFFNAGTQLGTWAPDLSDGKNQRVSAGGALTINPLTNPEDGATGNLVVSVNGQAITLGAGWRLLGSVPDPAGSTFFVLSFLIEGTNQFLTGDVNT